MNVHRGSVVNLSPEDCNPSILHGADDGAEISLIPPSSIQGEGEGGDDPLKSSFELGSFHFPAFNHTTSFNEYKGSLTPIQEVLAISFFMNE